MARLPEDHPEPIEAIPAAPANVPTFAEPPPEDELEDPGEPTAQELADIAIANPRMKLPWNMVRALQEEYKNNCRAEDDYGKRRARECIERLRRCSHPELHPNCPWVALTVPALKRADNKPGQWYVTINEKKYFGRWQGWECEARTILDQVKEHNKIERERMSDQRAEAEMDASILLSERMAAIRMA